MGLLDMLASSALDYRQSQQVHWKDHYSLHLRQRLVQSLFWVGTHPKNEIKSHLRSFLSLLEETRRHPALNQLSLQLIDALHPLPLRWGFGHLWETHLLAALKMLPVDDTGVVYHQALSEIYLSMGAFEKTIEQGLQVLALEIEPSQWAAEACRTLFKCYRANGNPEQADQVLASVGKEFAMDLPAAEISAEKAYGWLKVNQCRLELLREQDQVGQAYQLANDMIWLDGREGSLDPLLTAELYARRSTLLWVRGTYQPAVRDIFRAMELFRQGDDIFNAESLNSNLGLIYWTMGDFVSAEDALRKVIAFYTQSGADQLMNPDIGNLGLVYFARGDITQALHYTKEHITHAEKLGFVAEYHRGRTNLGTLLYYFGEYQHALDELLACQPYYQERGSRDGYRQDLAWIACCEYRLGRQEKALEQLKDVVRLSVESDAQVLEVVTRRCLSQFLSMEERLPHLRRCLYLVEKQNRRLEKAAVLLALAQVLPEQTDRQTTWQEGAALLRDIGCEAWLEGHSLDDPPFIPMFL
jgi:tetratricopeptide (TPR) repeat protein